MSNRDKHEIGHLISHTHWDREWRVPIWHSRMRLIKMMTSLLDTMEKHPEFKHFLFDGQVVGIKDYLAFCPEKLEKIKEYVSSGRLQIGPWYNLPDQFPVCGESLVRNLLTGVRQADKLGGVSRFGYTSFGWGQTAQLPQLYAGFGIDFIVTAKHVSKQRAPHSEFIWQSPDGTEVLTTRLGDEGRANFFFNVLMAVAYGVKYKDKKWRLHWGQNGWIWHRADTHISSEHELTCDFDYHTEILQAALNDVWDSTKDTLVKDHRFLGDGCDFVAPFWFIPKLIEDAGKLDNGRIVKYSGLEEYAAEVKKSLKNVELKIVKGELRDGPVSKVAGNALATRMPVKMINRDAQDMLIRYAEPFAVLASLLGVEYHAKFIDKAWHYLFLAQSHDAINGVTQDKTVDDTIYKLNQVIELGQVVGDFAAAGILQQVNFADYAEEDILLAVFNPNPRPVSQIVHATIDVPIERKAKWLSIDGSNGAVQPIHRERQTSVVNVENSRAMPFYCDRHTMYIDTGQIPACGYKILRLSPEGEYDPAIEFWHDVDDFGSQVTGPNKMANEYLEVAINSNGTFNLLHKETGKEFKNLNYFEDSGDIGDYWQRVPPAHNRTYNTLGSNAQIYLKEDGPLVTSYVCQVELGVPEQAVETNNRRNSKTPPLKISSQITLRSGNPYVEMQTEVHNQAEDHRLRVCMPTYLPAEYSWAMGHFGVDKRPISRPKDERGIRHGEMGTLPHQNFIDICADQIGFSLLNTNLIEYEVTDDESRTVTLTLLRSVKLKIAAEFRAAVVDPEQQGSQCLGRHKFNYAVFPHPGNWQQGDVYGTMEHYVLRPHLYQVSKHNKGTESKNQSLFSLQPNSLQLSAIKKTEQGDGIVIRLFNPTDKTIEGNIKLARKPQSAVLVNLNEDLQGQLPVDENGVVTFDAEPCKIITIKCTF